MDFTYISTAEASYEEGTAAVAGFTAEAIEKCKAKIKQAKELSFLGIECTLEELGIIAVTYDAENVETGYSPPGTVVVRADGTVRLDLEFTSPVLVLKIDDDGEVKTNSEEFNNPYEGETYDDGDPIEYDFDGLTEEQVALLKALYAKEQE